MDYIATTLSLECLTFVRRTTIAIPCIGKSLNALGNNKQIIALYAKKRNLTIWTSLNGMDCLMDQDLPKNTKWLRDRGDPKPTKA